MKTKICLLFICFPMLAHAQSCDWRKINFVQHKHQRLVLSAPDQPFFPVSDIIVNKQGFFVKPLYSKYNPVRIRALGKNRYRFYLKESKFALNYPGAAQDKYAAQYYLFRRGGYYTLTLFYNGSCREVAYAEISTALTDGGKTHRLQQKLTVQPDLVRGG